MKRTTLIFGLIFVLSAISYGQDSLNVFFDEFSVSINRTTLKNYNTENRFGFGIGAYHTFRSDKKLNLMFGLEFNHTSQFQKSMYEGHFANATDVTYNLNFFSIPVGLRLNFGSKTKVFTETGGFADLLIKSNRRGTMHTYLPDKNNHINYRKIEFNENAELSDTFGIYFGLGVRIPISKFELIIKPVYKFGINKLYSYKDDMYNRYFVINIGFKINQ